MSRKKSERRDTVKDIILGLEPSGSGPREPRGGYAKHATVSQANERRIQPIIVEGADTTAINRLQDRIQALQLQQNDLLNAEAQARKKLEKDYEDFKRKMLSNDPSRGIDELKRQLGNLESKVNSLSQELSMVRSMMDQLSRTELHRSEERSRYTDDHDRTSNQVKELAEQIHRLKQALEDEISDRNAASRSYEENINSVRDGILRDLNSKTAGIESRAVKGRELEEIRAETERLNDKLQRRLNEIERKLNTNETKLKENMKQERNSVENSIKQQIKMQQEDFEKLEIKTRNSLEECEKELHQLKTVAEEERQTSDERIKILEKNVSGLKKRLKSENDKLNSVLTADINTRKVHENGMLAKMDYMEEQLKAHFESIIKNVENCNKKSRPEQIFDIDTIRREMESIAADKNKMSIEGLLRMEEKIRKMNKDMSRYNASLRKKVNKLSENEKNGQLEQQMIKLNQLQQEFEDSQQRLADKIENQIPQDLNELSAKTNHIRQQLNDRIDRVEEDNFHAVKELREVKAAANNRAANPAENNLAGKSISKIACENAINAKLKPLEDDFYNYKIAVKKLAESVTTVKNVLEKRIDDELQKRATFTQASHSAANNK